MMMNYRDWYWIVAGDASRVYSTAVNAYVPVADMAYRSWLVSGNTPSRVMNEAELWNVVAPALQDVIANWMFDGTSFVPTAPNVYSKTQLIAYAAAKRYAIEIGGITIDAMPVATDRESQAMISGAFAYVQTNPDVTIQFKTASGFVALTAAQIVAVAQGVGGHVQSCFAKEAAVAAQIAGGALTSLSAVDAAFDGA